MYNSRFNNAELLCISIPPGILLARSTSAAAHITSTIFIQENENTFCRFFTLIHNVQTDSLREKKYNKRVTLLSIEMD